MSQALSNLLALLDLEKIEEGLFRGQSEDLGLRQVFGGQVVGQALYAAKETVPVERLVHSFHSYFLRPGDSQKPIVYDVEVLRDGNSFSARRVAAIQNGKPIPLRITPSVAEQEGQQTETEATGAPQKHHYTLNQQVGSITSAALAGPHTSPISGMPGIATARADWMATALAFWSFLITGSSIIAFSGGISPVAT